MSTVTKAQQIVLDALTDTPQTPAAIKRAMPGATPVATVRRLLAELQAAGLAQTAQGTGGVTAWVRAARDGQAWHDFGRDMHAVSGHVQSLQAGLDDALMDVLADEDHQGLVEAVAWVQDVRRALAEVETTLTTFGTMNLDVPKTGALADGRAYTLRRSAERKGWQHDEWKRAARLAVLARDGLPAEAVNPETGEVVNLLGYAADVQAVAGSAPPKLTALRALGIDPDEYAETIPGRWSVKVEAPGEDDDA